MLNLILFGLLTHAARSPRCTRPLLGAKLRQVAVTDDAEITRQQATLATFQRVLRATLKKRLPKFTDRGYVRVVSVEPGDQSPDLHPGWGPRDDGDYEAWLTVPGRLVRDTSLGPKPTPYAEELLKFCAEQELKGELFHWEEKERWDGLPYGQWYRVTERVTSPTIPPEPHGRARTDIAGSMRRREPDERNFTLSKGQPATYVRISWR